MLLGINFLPLWLPTYSCLLPQSCAALSELALLPPSTCHEWGLGPAEDSAEFGVATCAAFAALGLGACWQHFEVLVKKVGTEGRLWPVSVLTPYYSGYCTGYKPDVRPSAPNARPNVCSPRIL